MRTLIFALTIAAASTSSASAQWTKESDTAYAKTLRTAEFKFSGPSLKALISNLKCSSRTTRGGEPFAALTVERFQLVASTVFPSAVGTVTTNADTLTGMASSCKEVEKAFAGVQEVEAKQNFKLLKELHVVPQGVSGAGTYCRMSVVEETAAKIGKTNIVLNASTTFEITGWSDGDCSQY